MLEFMNDTITNIDFIDNKKFLDNNLKNLKNKNFSDFRSFSYLNGIIIISISNCNLFVFRITF